MPVWGVSFPFDLIVSFTPIPVFWMVTVCCRGTFLPAMMMILSAEVLVWVLLGELRGRKLNLKPYYLDKW